MFAQQSSPLEVLKFPAFLSVSFALESSLLSSIFLYKSSEIGSAAQFRQPTALVQVIQFNLVVSIYLSSLFSLYLTALE